jgi:hypothetical protein
MSDFTGKETAEFAPQADDSIRELRWKAESMLDWLRVNEASLRRFPTGFVDERIAMWEPLASLIARAMENPKLADDARLEAHRVWAEEMRLSALNTVTMAAHARSESAKKRFADSPELLKQLILNLENARPAALRLLSTEDRDELRGKGFLRPGE